MHENLLSTKKVDPADSKQNFLHIPLSLHCCRYWVFQEWELTNMSFPFWRIYYNIIPGAYIIYNGKTTFLTPDEIIIIPPNTSYSNGFKSSNDLIEKESIVGERINSSINIDCLREQNKFDHFFIHFNLGMPYDIVNPGVYTIKTNSQFISLINTIKQFCITETNYFSFNISLTIHSLVIQLLSNLPAKIWPTGDINPRMQKVIKYIEYNLNNSIENAVLAALVNMSTNAFARFFKQHMNESVQNYITKQRIEMAQLLLHHSNESIENIASKCGFCDRYHFSKIFKTYTSMSPAYYKKTLLL